MSERKRATTAERRDLRAAERDALRRAPAGAGPRAPAGTGVGVPGRRTVTIRGQVSSPARRHGSRRPSQRRYERAGFVPDRAALWAFLLGVLLILVAVTSAHS